MSVGELCHRPIPDVLPLACSTPLLMCWGFVPFEGRLHSPYVLVGCSEGTSNGPRPVRLPVLRLTPPCRPTPSGSLPVRSFHPTTRFRTFNLFLHQSQSLHQFISQTFPFTSPFVLTTSYSVLPFSPPETTDRPFLTCSRCPVRTELRWLKIEVT